MVKLMARQEGWTKSGSKELEDIDFKGKSVQAGRHKLITPPLPQYEII